MQSTHSAQQRPSVLCWPLAQPEASKPCRRFCLHTARHPSLESRQAHLSRLSFAASVNSKRIWGLGHGEHVLLMDAASPKGMHAGHAHWCHRSACDVLRPWLESQSALRCPPSRLRQTLCARSRLPSRHGTRGTRSACRWATRLVRLPLYLKSAEAKTTRHMLAVCSKHWQNRWLPHYLLWHSIRIPACSSLCV